MFNAETDIAGKERMVVIITPPFSTMFLALSKTENISIVKLNSLSVNTFSFFQGRDTH